MVEKFLNYLKYELNRSPRTIQSYSEDLMLFERYFKSLDRQLSWETIDADVIRDWMESMMDKGNSASSVNRRLAALHTLFRFSLAHHLVEKDPSRGIEAPRKARPLPQFLKEEEMDRLLDQSEWGPDYESLVTRTIIMTFYETGMRLSELVGLNDENIDMNNRQLKVTGKGSKQRVIPFGDELARNLRLYQRERDKDFERKTNAFFVSRHGERFTAAQVRWRVEKAIARVSTIKKKSPHVLRHTFATALLNHKADIESVRKLLGHESVSTTEIYTHVSFEQLKREYKEAHPRA